MVKIQKTKDNQHFLTIPLYVINALGLNKGDEVDFFIDLKNGVITLKRVGK
jgi:bifunctional DNA-binding transcriptional regulator/antitoxin component of YhaV-PrlF toxin-antitoxin module